MLSIGGAALSGTDGTWKPKGGEKIIAWKDYQTGVTN
jgi:hypothetical protein